MKETFVETLYCNNLIEALKLWIKISTFIKRDKIYSNKYDELLKKEKIQLYVNDMDKFNDWVEKFYSYGNNTFMKLVKNGDSETFYLHTLRFYMPDIIRDTWELHGVGVGIFSMQGFERRNQESKRIMQNHTNNRGNIIVQNLIRLSMETLI